MLNTLWNDNPLILGIYNAISYFNNTDDRNIFKLINNSKNNKNLNNNKNDLDKYELIILNINNILLNSNIPNELNKITFNNLKKNHKICLITNESKYHPKNLKNILKLTGYDLIDVNILSMVNIILLNIQNILVKKINPENIKYNISNIEHIYKIGIICTDEVFIYIKNVISKRYKNCALFPITNKFTNCIEFDYIFIASLFNKYFINDKLKNMAKWLYNNSKSTIFICGNQKRDLNFQNNIDFYYPNELINLSLDIINNDILKDNNDDNSNNKFALSNPIKIIGKPNLDCYLSKILRQYKIKNNNNSNENIDINITIDNTNNKIPVLMVGNTIEYDMEFASKINCDKCLILSEELTIDKLKEEVHKKIIDNIEYIIPDFSYMYKS